MKTAAEGKELSNIDENIIKEARRTTQKALNAEQGFNELASTSNQRHRDANQRHRDANNVARGKRLDNLVKEIKGEHTGRLSAQRENG